MILCLSKKEPILKECSLTGELRAGDPTQPADGDGPCGGNLSHVNQSCLNF